MSVKSRKPCWICIWGWSVTNSRTLRQIQVKQWAERCFGEAQVASPTQRGLRFLEEAIELYQAVGCDREQAHKLVDFIFDRPVGEPAQEVGGVSVTLLCLCQTLGIDADDAEVAEIDRILSKPAEHFAARNAAKNDAGFSA